MRLTTVMRNRKLRKQRVRASITGTTKRPRLSVFVSHRNVIAQLIDDSQQATVAYATTVNNKSTKEGTMTEKAIVIGEEIAKKAKAKNIKQVVFDRNGRLYHGRVKALADAARKEGLEF